MGLFDRFKKPGPNQFTCVICKRVLDTKYLHANQTCSDCFAKTHTPKPYTKKQEKPVVQNTIGNSTANEFSSEHADFQMTVDDIFPVQGRGIVLRGTIGSGTVHLKDTVIVNGKNYRVVGIEISMKLVTLAKAGDLIGLLVEAHNPNDFKKGDVVHGAKDSPVAAPHQQTQKQRNL